MRGDAVSKIAGIIILVVVIVLVASYFTTAPLAFSSPLEETRKFYDLCIYWAANNFEGTSVIDNKDNIIDMEPSCRKVLGMSETETILNPEDFWKRCRSNCPGGPPLEG